MDGSSSFRTLDALIRNGGFLRDLARGLVGDEHGAEDALQEVCLAALESPHEAPAAPRAWFRSVLRNLTAREHRGMRRRRLREERVARTEAVPGTGESVAREELLRGVLEAVLNLDSIHREVVLLRFYEGLPPRKIAARLGLTVAAVKSRLSRAVVKPRRELDGIHAGDRRAWAVPLIAATGLGPSLSAMAGGATHTGWILMTTKWKIALFSALLIAVGSAAWLLDLGSAPFARNGAAPRGAAGGGTSTSSGQGNHDAQPGATPITTEAFPRDKTGQALATLIWNGDMRILGRVVDGRRVPIAGAQILFNQAGERARTAVSGPSGRFEVETRAPQRRGGTWSLIARDDQGRAGVLQRRGADLRSIDRAFDMGTLVLRNGHSLSVRVVDGGKTVASAHVTLRTGLTGFEASVGGAVTTSEGVVRWDCLPRGIYQVRASTPDGHVGTARVDLDHGLDGSAILELHRGTDLQIEVCSEAIGKPVPGARVRAWRQISPGLSIPIGPGPTLASTDASGRTRIRGLEDGETLLIAAAAPGFVPPSVTSGGSSDRQSSRDIRVTVGAVKSAVRITLTPLVLARWQVIPGECPVPADGTRLRFLQLPSWRVLTGIRGSISVGILETTGLDPGFSDVLAVTEKGHTARLTERPEEGAPLVEVAFRKPRRVEVLVCDEGGLPVSGLPLVVASEARLPSRQEEKTDVEGRAVFRGFLGGTVSVYAFPSALVRVPSEDLLGVANVEEHDALLQVTRERGLPIVAHISCNGNQRLPSNYVLRSDDIPRSGLVEYPDAAELRFTLWPRRPGEAIRLLLQSPGFSPARATVTASMPRTTTEVALALESALSLRVIVHPPSNGDYALVFEKKGDGGAWKAIWTPAFGHPAIGHTYDCVAPKPGLYRVRDQTSGLATLASVVVQGSSATTLELDLTQNLWIHGRVTAPQASLLPGVTLVASWKTQPQRSELESTRIVLRKDGQFALRTEVDRTVTFQVDHPVLRIAREYSQETVKGPLENVMLQLEMGPTCLLVFHPRPAAARPGIFSLGVDLFTAGTNGQPVASPRPTRDWRDISRTGRARFGRYKPGTYDIQVDPDPYAPVLLRGVRLGDGTTDLKVPLSSGASLKVELDIAEGQERPRVRVTAIRLGNPTFNRSRRLSSDQSQVTVPGLPRGRYVVEIRLRTSAGRRKITREVESDGTSNLILNLREHD